MSAGYPGLLAVLARTVTGPSYAQELFALSRRSGPVQLDGLMTPNEQGWMRTALLSLVMMLVACAPLTLEQRLDMRSRSTRLCITNETAAMGNLQGWVEGFGRKYNVMGGREQCQDFPIAAMTTLLVNVQTIGGSMWGPTRASAVVPLRGGACWEWVVRIDAITDGIRPCRTGSRNWGL